MRRFATCLEPILLVSVRILIFNLGVGEEKLGFLGLHATLPVSRGPSPGSKQTVHFLIQLSGHSEQPVLGFAASMSEYVLLTHVLFFHSRPSDG